MPPAAAQSPYSVYHVAPEEDAQLGLGYDIDSGEVKTATCVDFSTTTTTLPTPVTWVEASNLSGDHASYGLPADWYGSSPGGFVLPQFVSSPKPLLAAALAMATDRFDINVRFSAHAISRTVVASSARLRPTYQQLAASDPGQFRRACGNAYIAEVGYGGTYRVLLRRKADSQTSFNQMAQALPLSEKGAIVDKAVWDLVANPQASFLRSSLAAQCDQRGGRVVYTCPANSQSLSMTFVPFLKAFLDPTTPIAKTRLYARAYPGVAVVPSGLASFVYWKLSALARLKDIDYVINNPQQFWMNGLCDCTPANSSCVPELTSPGAAAASLQTCETTPARNLERWRPTLERLRSGLNGGIAKLGELATACAASPSNCTEAFVEQAASALYSAGLFNSYGYFPQRYYGTCPGSFVLFEGSAGRNPTVPMPQPSAAALAIAPDKTYWKTLVRPVSLLTGSGEMGGHCPKVKVDSYLTTFPPVTPSCDLFRSVKAQPGSIPGRGLWVSTRVDMAEYGCCLAPLVTPSQAHTQVTFRKCQVDKYIDMTTAHPGCFIWHDNFGYPADARRGYLEACAGNDNHKWTFFAKGYPAPAGQPATIATGRAIQSATCLSDTDGNDTGDLGCVAAYSALRVLVRHEEEREAPALPGQAQIPSRWVQPQTMQVQAASSSQQGSVSAEIARANSAATRMRAQFTEQR